MRRAAVAMCVCALALAGCGSGSTVTQTVVERAPRAPAAHGEHLHTIPALKGKRLDVAEEFAKEADVPYKVIGGGLFGVVIASHWTVCEQTPPAGALAAQVKLVVARSC